VSGSEQSGSESPASGFVPRGACPFCGYALDPGTCPECGHVVTDASLVTTRLHARVLKWERLPLASKIAALPSNLLMFLKLLVRPEELPRQTTPDVHPTRTLLAFMLLLAAFSLLSDLRQLRWPVWYLSMTWRSPHLDCVVMALVLNFLVFVLLKIKPSARIVFWRATLCGISACFVFYALWVVWMSLDPLGFSGASGPYGGGRQRLEYVWWMDLAEELTIAIYPLSLPVFSLLVFPIMAVASRSTQGRGHRWQRQARRLSPGPWRRGGERGGERGHHQSCSVQGLL
jgi:hypothetical protein